MDISGGFGLFFSDDTGEERTQETMDRIQMVINDEMESFGFSIKQYGTVDQFMEFFGKMLLDRIIYYMRHGEYAAQRTHERASEALESLQDEVKAAPDDVILQQKAEMLKELLGE
ncbi:MAG: hypothetical protein ACYDHX_08050 [Methanothrix sp.]